MIQELWINHFITWEQVNGKFDRNEGYLEPGDGYKVIARCRLCNHSWTVRGALQIDDIVK